MKSISRTLSLVCLLLSYHALALSQTASTGALTGVVIDSAGAVVVDAQVKVINEATKEARAVATQSNGSYSLPLLPPGAYRVEFSKAGFKSAVKAGLQRSEERRVGKEGRAGCGAGPESGTAENGEGR